MITQTVIRSDAPLAPFTFHARWLCVSICLALMGCSGQSVRQLVPPRIAGQIPSDYQIEPGRALVLARFKVHTNGETGFGVISNPMLVQFRDVSLHGAAGTPDESPQGLSMPNPDARIWTSESARPTLWQYSPPGLMAASFKPGTYDGLVIAYPDTHHEGMPDSIPAPSQGMRFDPLELKADTIVYIGTIDIEQHYGMWDQFLDRVNVDFSVSDDYERTVADFRARYPQFRDSAVEMRLAKVVAPAK